MKLTYKNNWLQLACYRPSYLYIGFGIPCQGSDIITNFLFVTLVTNIIMSIAIVVVIIVISIIIVVVVVVVVIIVLNFLEL